MDWAGPRHRRGQPWTVSVGVPALRCDTDLWLDLAATHHFKGKKANGIERLLTFNVSDFATDSAFTILAP